MSDARIRRFRLGLTLLALTASCGVVRGAATTDAPILMAPVTVGEVRTSIKIRPVVSESSAGPRIVSLEIEEVRKGSPAALAGLSAGLEIVAIGGIKVRGRELASLDPLWRGPFLDDTLVLSVARARRGSSPVTPRPYEIRIPLQKPPLFKTGVSVTFEKAPSSPASAPPEPATPSAP